MNLSEKAAYIRGLCEGLDLDASKKENRVIKEMVELLAEMASDIEDIGTDMTELYDIVEEIDEDLGMVEEEVYGLLDDGEELYEVLCPGCGDTVVLDEAMLLKGEVECPGCGAELEIDGCDCGCGHDHGEDEG